MKLLALLASQPFWHGIFREKATNKQMGSKPNEVDKKRIAIHLQISLGFMQLAQALLRATAGEPELRTGFSRLYYAFFHVSFALLLSLGFKSRELAHGQLPKEIDRLLGKDANVGRLIRNLYVFRRVCDYDNPTFSLEFGDVEKGRREAVYELRRSIPTFNWIYYEARKVIAPDNAP